MTAAVRFDPTGGWRVAPLRLRGVRTAGLDPFVERLVASGRLALEDSFAALPSKAKRGGEASPLVAEVEAAAAPDDSMFVFLARHPSGALTIHPAARRGTGATRFAMRLSRPGALRSVAGKAVKLFLLRVAAPLLSRSLPELAREWEATNWGRKGLVPGLVRVTPEGLRRGFLPRLDALPASRERSLLLLPGTFSHTAAAFEGLANPAVTRHADFFRVVAPAYGDRIYGYDHFTVSVSPEENARALLETLPHRTQLLDVVAHSRGALVIRAIVERPDLFGGRAQRLGLGRAVFVASPNDGTALAEPERWEPAIGWLANLADLFPGGPLSFAMELVADAIGWIAHRLLGELPGLAAMRRGSPFLSSLNAPPGDARYATVSAHFAAESGLAERLLDAGAGALFREPNDLVVPAAGAAFGAPPERALALGPGPANHVNLFSRAPVVRFLAAALTAGPASSTAKSLRSGGGDFAARAPEAAPDDAPRADSREAPRAVRRRKAPAPRLELTLLSDGGRAGEARLLAAYGGARVLEPVSLRGGAAGERTRRVIAFHERILRHLDGRPGAPDLPSERETAEAGRLLFEILLPGDARRLWDEARAAAAGGVAEIVLTSSIDWLADKPWELAFDPARKVFLAAGDAVFVRNVFTAVPVAVPRRRRGPIRLLVVAAQPTTAATLSVAEEEETIRAGFEPLVAAGLAVVDVLRAATPESLHRKLASGRWDVLHFIGHGAFDETARTGFLLFEDGSGRERPLDAGRLTRLVSGRGLSLVFLNACETGRGGRADFTRGVAPALAASGLPAVVANQYKVFDGAATSFARHFYWSLARGESVGAAAREARVAVDAGPDASPIDFAVPVVYARDPGAILAHPL